MHIRSFQKLMKDLYINSDGKRGVHRTALWLVEEIGELASQLKKNEKDLSKKDVKENIEEEMADIYAWVASLANLLDIDLDGAVQRKYPKRCPKCRKNPCICNKF